MGVRASEYLELLGILPHVVGSPVSQGMEGFQRYNGGQGNKTVATSVRLARCYEYRTAR